MYLPTKTYTGNGDPEVLINFHGVFYLEKDGGSPERRCANRIALRTPLV